MLKSGVDPNADADMEPLEDDETESMEVDDSIQRGASKFVDVDAAVSDDSEGE